MKRQLITWFLPVIIDSVLKSFTLEDIKRYLDSQIDRLENYIHSSASSVDDAFLPVIKTIREALDLPDFEDKEVNNESS